MRDILLVRPESKWRWLPLAIAPLALAAWTMRALEDGEAQWFLIGMSLAVLALGAAGWLGHFGAFARAKADCLVSGRVRVASHTRLALALKIIGGTLIGVCVLDMVWPLETWIPIVRDEASRLGVELFVGFPIAVAGWYRPWDLKVVERDGAASEVTT